MENAHKYIHKSSSYSSSPSASKSEGESPSVLTEKNKIYISRFYSCRVDPAYSSDVIYMCVYEGVGVSASAFASVSMSGKLIIGSPFYASAPFAVLPFHFSGDRQASSQPYPPGHAFHPVGHSPGPQPHPSMPLQL